MEDHGVDNEINIKLNYIFVNSCRFIVAFSRCIRSKNLLRLPLLCVHLTHSERIMT